jgi:hypothetical protein
MYKTMKILRLGETSGVLITQVTPAFIWSRNAWKTIVLREGDFAVRHVLMT